MEARERVSKMSQVEKQGNRIQKNIKHPLGETKKPPAGHQVFENCLTETEGM